MCVFTPQNPLRMLSKQLCIEYVYVYIYIYTYSKHIPHLSWIDMINHWKCKQKLKTSQ